MHTLKDEMMCWWNVLWNLFI